MMNSPHPGHGIRVYYLEALGLNVTEAAREPGVARLKQSRVLDGNAGISLAMVIRPERACWAHAGFWRRRQIAYDLAQAAIESMDSVSAT